MTYFDPNRVRELQAEVEQLRAELAVFKAPPDFHNADHDATLLELWKDIITEHRNDPAKAAHMLLTYARTAIWSAERETARWADMAQAFIAAREETNAERQPAEPHGADPA
ncbi:hypothetical protein [Nonomuraea sp. NPDC005650]|uniref:hypothetical protein n=1 Tax=Nonomuraea sp. NPDC005650 TaxID=3157045 RepID=UPI0033BA2571